MKNRNFIFALFIISISLFSGCATVKVRFNPNEERESFAPLYPATTLIWCEILEPVFFPNGDRFRQKMALLWLPIEIIDVPISVVTDTVCLPIDVYYTYSITK